MYDPSAYCGRREMTDEELLNNYAPIPDTGCWIWLGSVSSRGYGIINRSRGRVKIFAHVFFDEHFKGPIPPGLERDHLCRVRCCVNPDHLEWVTHLENVARMKVKLSNQQVCEIRGSQLSSWELGKLYDITPQYVNCLKRRDNRRGDNGAIS
jgi:hypothetical protein